MFGLDEKTLEIIDIILSGNDKIKKRVIFGSRATGKYKKTSDIDIALFGNLNFRDISFLKGEFEESDCIYKVDVVHYESLENDKLKENIDKEGIEF